MVIFLQLSLSKQASTDRAAFGIGFRVVMTPSSSQKQSESENAKSFIMHRIKQDGQFGLIVTKIINSVENILGLIPVVGMKVDMNHLMVLFKEKEMNRYSLI